MVKAKGYIDWMNGVAVITLFMLAQGGGGHNVVTTRDRR